MTEGGNAIPGSGVERDRELVAFQRQGEAGDALAMRHESTWLISRFMSVAARTRSSSCAAAVRSHGMASTSWPAPSRVPASSTTRVSWSGSGSTIKPATAFWERRELTTSWSPRAKWRAWIGTHASIRTVEGWR